MNTLKSLAVTLAVGCFFALLAVVAGIEECRQRKTLGQNYEGPLNDD